MRLPSANPNPPYEVILRRANGSFVKSEFRTSAYAAKRLAAAWRDDHDETYVVETKHEVGGSHGASNEGVESIRPFT